MKHENEINCPSCKTPWEYDDTDIYHGQYLPETLKNPYPKLCRCGFKITQLRNVLHDGCKILTALKEIDKYIIYWNFDLKTCHLSEHPFNKGDLINPMKLWSIPMAPIDIDENLLKLYLTFL